MNVILSPVNMGYLGLPLYIVPVICSWFLLEATMQYLYPNLHNVTTGVSLLFYGGANANII